MFSRHFSDWETEEAERLLLWFGEKILLVDFFIRILLVDWMILHDRWETKRGDFLSSLCYKVLD